MAVGARITPIANSGWSYRTIQLNTTHRRATVYPLVREAIAVGRLAEGKKLVLEA
jgi:hypothetical protein